MKQGNVSSWVEFLRAIKGKGYTKATIERKFLKMVDKEDYKGVPRQKLVNHALKFC